MTGLLHIYIPNRVIDNNGISDGASLAFYHTGTTTLASIYSDSALTIPLENPVVVAAGAEVPDIYLDSTITYRRIITYSDGSTDDSDPWSNEFVASQDLSAGTGASMVGWTGSGTGAVSRTISDYLSDMISVMDFIPQSERAKIRLRISTINLASYFQAANDAAVARGGGCIYVPEGLYYIGTPINVGNYVRFKGESHNAVVKRTATATGSAMFILGSDTADTQSPAIECLTLDMNNAPAFYRLVQIGQSTISGVGVTVNTVYNAQVHNNIFTDSNPALDHVGGDQWAVLFRGHLSGTKVTWNRVNGDMQVTAGGTGNMYDTLIAYNNGRQGWANGIAVSTPGDVIDMKVIGNDIECQSLCVFLGPDAIYSGVTTGSWRGVLVDGNTLRTQSSGSDTSWMGVYLNAAPVTYDDVHVVNNTIECRDASSNQIGIRLDDANTYGKIVDNVVIDNNTVRGGRTGIQVNAGGSVTIGVNTVTDCGTGIQIANATKPCAIGASIITGGSIAVEVNNGTVNLTGTISYGGAEAFKGRLFLNPSAGKTADVTVNGGRFADGTAQGTANVYGVSSAGAGTKKLSLIGVTLTGNTTAVDTIAPEYARDNVGYAGVTAFPTSPITGQKCYRADRNIEYYWDGTRWLSVELFNTAFNPTDTNLPISSTQSYRRHNPLYGQYDIYVTRSNLTAYITTATPASNYFQLQITYNTGAATTNVGGTINTSTFTQNQWAAITATPNTVIPSTAMYIEGAVSKTGTPSGYVLAGFSYRLVG